MVSKVVMSICALLVAGTLAGAVENALDPSQGCDLEHILTQLQGKVSAMCASGGEWAMAWPVPSAPSGVLIRMSFAPGSVAVSAEGVTRTAETWPVLHTWTWDGTPMNSTRAAELDRTSAILSFVTGYSVQLSSRLVLLDDSEELLAFVS